MLAPVLALQSFSCIKHCRSSAKENLCVWRHSIVKLLPGILPQKHIMHFVSLFPMHTPEIDPYSITQRGARIMTLKGHDEIVQLSTRHICCIVSQSSVPEDMAICWQIVLLKRQRCERTGRLPCCGPLPSTVARRTCSPPAGGLGSPAASPAPAPAQQPVVKHLCNGEGTEPSGSKMCAESLYYQDPA